MLKRIISYVVFCLLVLPYGIYLFIKDEIFIIKLKKSDDSSVKRDENKCECIQIHRTEFRNRIETCTFCNKPLN
jgi:hypothetical protein